MVVIRGNKFLTCHHQTCIAANRILVQDGIINEYIDKLSKSVAKLRLGPGFTEGVNQGPLINHPAIDKVCHCSLDNVKFAYVL